jgi:hypothetical protein
MARTIPQAGLTAAACVLLTAASCGRVPSAAVQASNNRAGAPGLTFTIRMAATSFSGRPSRADSVPIQFLDGVARIDYRGGPDASGQRAVPGFHVLVNSMTKTTTLVMPTSKQYWETRFDSAHAQRAQSSTVISDIDVSGQTIGSGGTVNGYTTTRYRITTRYTETPSGARRGEGRRKMHVVEDLWVSEALKDVPDPLQAYLRVFPPSGTHGELADKQAKTRLKLFKGLPVRTVWLLTQTFDDGTTASRSTSIDILDLKRADLDPAAFRVPNGYARFDLAARLNAIELLLQDARKASGKGRKTP